MFIANGENPVFIRTIAGKASCARSVSDRRTHIILYRQSLIFSRKLLREKLFFWEKALNYSFCCDIIMVYLRKAFPCTEKQKAVEISNV